MRIALAQTSILWEGKDENIQFAISIIDDCIHKKVDVVYFPEMSFTGFSMNTEVTGETDNYTINRMSEIANKSGVAIGFGWVEKIGGKCKNQYSVIDKNGVLLSTYAKIHPFSCLGEDKFFDGGNEITTFQIEDVPFSNFICYDLRFPELFRSVADKVHAIIIPACWPAKRSEHWKVLLKARAIENQVYIFAVNCQGDIGGIHYSGNSCIINPDGKILEMLSDKDGLVIYDFLDDVENYRSSFPVLKDRKMDLYKKF